MDGGNALDAGHGVRSDARKAARHESGYCQAAEAFARTGKLKNSRSAAIGKPEALAQLRKVTDCHLASLRGIDSESVRQKRRSLGIPSSFPRRHRKWTEAERALMGTASGLEVAAQVGCAVAQAWYALNKREVLAFHPVFPGLMPCYSNLVLCPMRMSLRPRECPFWKARDRNGGYRRSDR